MKCFKPIVVFGCVMFGGLISATAGVQGVVKTEVEALSGTVTYRIGGASPLNTLVGYKVTITRSGTNTVNNVVFKGTTAVVVSSSGLPNSAESAVFDEADDDGGACQADTTNPSAVVCNFGQMRAGDIRTFAVFFKAPVESAGNCFVANGPSCEVVRFSGTTNYSEGPNDNTGSAPNDQSEWVWIGSADVPLGTANPTDVKSALSKSGGEFSTGADGVPSVATFPFATKLAARNPPVYSSASIKLKKFTVASDNTQVQFCAAEGNFYNCYEADIAVPNVTYVPGPDYMTILLRIDSTEVKNPFRPENIKVFHGANDINPLPACNSASGLPPLGEQRCVAGISRKSNSGSLGEQRRDVEIEVHAFSNGPFRAR